MGKTLVNGKTKAQRTRELIFQTSLALFRQKGFERVTIEDITRNAGVAKGSFYSYFETKSDIIVEAFWNIDTYYRSLAGLLEKCPTAAGKLLMFTEHQMRYVRDSIGCDLLKVLYANQVLNKGSEKAITDRTRFWHTFIVKTMKEGQETGEFRASPDAGQLAVWFNRAIRGMFLDWNIASGSFDLVEASLAYCRDFLLESLKTQTPAASVHPIF